MSEKQESSFSIFERSPELTQKPRKSPGPLLVIIIIAALGMAYGLYSSGLFGGLFLHSENTPPPDSGEAVISQDEGAQGETDGEAAPDYVSDPEKTVYITFSSGPSDNTPAILDVLLAQNVKATFFLTGRLIPQYAETVRRIAAEGNSIGIQSYSGDASRLYQNADTFTVEIENTVTVLRDALGEGFGTSLMRLLSSSTSANFKDLAEQTGYRTIGWNCNIGDDIGSVNTSPQSLYDYFVESRSQLADPNHLVILCNDGANSEYTAAALNMIIEQLKSEQFTFCVYEQ